MVRKPRRRNRTDAVSPELRAFLSRERAVVHVRYPVFPVRGDPPALVVSDDAYDLEPFRVVAGSQSLLATTLSALSALVCRIDVRRDPAAPMVHVGTGILVAPDLVLTCRHVAAAFAQPTDATWQFRTGGVQAAVCFAAVPDDGTAPFIPVSEVVFAGSSSREGLVFDLNEPELALLRLAAPAPEQPAHGDAFGWQKDLDPQADSVRAVAVASYPANPFVTLQGRKVFSQPDLRNVPVRLVEVQFEPGGVSLYGTRCVTVGLMTPSSTATDTHRLFAAHDCSTLGGSSGGAVIDLETGKIIGVHCGGEFRRQNQLQLFFAALNRIGRATELRTAMTAAGIAGV